MKKRRGMQWRRYNLAYSLPHRASLSQRKYELTDGNNYQNQWGMLFLKKKAPASNAPVVVEMGFYKNHGFPDFGSKVLSNPKDDMTKHDARHHISPM